MCACTRAQGEATVYCRHRIDPKFQLVVSDSEHKILSSITVELLQWKSDPANSFGQNLTDIQYSDNPIDFYMKYRCDN